MARGYHIPIAVVSTVALWNEVIERVVFTGEFPQAVEAGVALSVQNGFAILLLSEKVDRLDIDGLSLGGRRTRAEDFLRERDGNLGATPPGMHDLDAALLFQRCSLLVAAVFVTLMAFSIAAYEILASTAAIRCVCRNRYQ